MKTPERWRALPRRALFVSILAQKSSKDVKTSRWDITWRHDIVLWRHMTSRLMTKCERGRDSCCRWRPEIGENAGIHWSVTKYHFLISLGKYVFSERWRSLLSEYIYFLKLIRNWFLVTLHWIPAFSRISGRHLQQESRPRSQMALCNLHRSHHKKYSENHVFQSGDLDLWPKTLTFELGRDIIKGNIPAKS